MNKKLYLFVVMFFVLSFYVVAYDSNNLMRYFSFDNDGSKTILDSRLNGNLVSDTFTTTATGIKSYGNTNITRFYGNVSYMNTFSINFWATAHLNSQYYFCFNKNNNCSLAVADRLYLQSHNVPNYYSLTSGSGSSIYLYANPMTSFHMITIIYYSAINTSLIYVDGILTNTSNISGYSSLTTNFTIQNIGNGDVIDEMSIWDTTLTQSDILLLYNSGFGRNYNATLELSGSKYEQTFEYFDICIPSSNGVQDLCHDLFFNSTDGLFCPYSQTETCSLGCIDNSTYWNSINSEPIDRNYSGRCSVNYIGLQTCQTVNETRCENITSVQTCLNNSFGISKWITTNTCINSATCINGGCYLPGESPTNTDNDGFFSGFSTQTMYYIMLFSTIAVFIITVIFLAIFGEALAGVIAGLILAMVTCLVLTIIFNLTLVIPILFIIIGGIGVAFLIRKSFSG